MNKEKMLKTLSALMITSVLVPTGYSQSSRIDRGRINLPTDIKNPRIPGRQPGKGAQFSVSEKEVLAEQRQRLQYLSIAVKYFKKNPQEIENHMDLRSYKRIEKLVLEKNLKALEKLDTPKAQYKRGGGENSKFLFNGNVTGLAEFGQTIYDSETRQNLLKVYKQAYSLLNKSQKAAYMSPDRLNNASAKILKSNLLRLHKILRNLKLVPSEDSRSGFKWDCDDEIGQQRVGTGDNARRCEVADYHPDSLWNNTNTADFPLKYYNTCIKSQGSRGTCVSFAITAAVESLLMLKEKKSYNLSEQFTYLFGEVYSNHSGRYSYGLNTRKALKKMDSKNVRFQYERWWEYNPSSSMGEKSGKIHPNSCIGYNGEMCTDYAFQSREKITYTPFKTYTYTVPHMGTAKNIQIVDTGNIWLPWAKSLSLDLAISLTKQKKPLVVSFNVKKNFFDAGDDGYVYHKSSQTHKGGHASVILGFVPNNKLPSGVTPAKEKGFFIVKNSWGTWNGDCGYYYVDYKYFRKHAKGLYTVKIN